MMIVTNHRPDAESRPTPEAAPAKTIAYVMSRFPKISETFVLYEIVELERLGMHVEIFPLIRQNEQVRHAESARLVERAHYSRVPSAPILKAQLHWLRRRPGAYLKAWWRSIAGNLGSRKFLSRALVVMPQAAWFAQEMERLGVEHVHAHFATHPALAAYIVNQLTGIPYSFTAHAHDIYVERPMLGEKTRAASFIVAISDYNRRLFGEWYGPDALEKTRVIHCGVDPEVFAPQPSAAPNPVFTIVCVASLQDYKGHAYLLDACAHLKKQNIEFQCLLIGDGEDRPQIEAHIAELGLADEVVLLGSQPRDRVRDYVARADVIVQPSVVTPSGKKEGIPVALMEALTAERPVVATAISGIPELVEHERTGLLVPERDAQALADALLRLYRDPELGKRLAAAGSQKVAAEFNLQTNTAALYRLLNRHLPGRSA